MLKIIIFLALAIAAVSLLSISISEGAISILIVAVMSCITILLLQRYTEDKEFLTSAFLGALALRLFFGIIVHVYDLRVFTGGDAIGYDYRANKIIDYWMGNIPYDYDLSIFLSFRGSGWGMQYLVSLIYLVSDSSILAAQSFCGVIGAATIPVVYFCSQSIFQNRRVSRISSIAVALCPAFIIWSSQLLKDGLMVFLLALAFTLVIKLQREFSWIGVAWLVFSIFGVLSLRFYVFYFLVAAIFLSLIIGLSTTFKSVIQRAALIGVVSVALVYLGVFGIAERDIGEYGSLERVQMSRSDLANSADSGYGGEEDVSTVGGALTALPIGFIYLMFAPFPWEATNFRQSITLPDSIVWWFCFPFVISGLWYSLRHRIRSALPILLFSFLLTFAYSMFQGNVGTAYRQRTQVQVFLFIFFAVGVGLLLEKRADKKILQNNRKLENERKLRERLLVI